MSDTRRHVVQFYENQRFLHQRVQQFFDRALDERQPSVMIARRSTYEGVIGGLVASRGGMSDAINGIRFVDAAAALDGFMVGRTPDPVRFEKMLAPLCDELRPSGDGALRIYGEMVDLLCRTGNHDAALRLEQFGERLMQEQPVSLLCAYALESFDTDKDARQLRAVCDHHTDVLAAEGADGEFDQRTREEHVVLLRQRSRVLGRLRGDRAPAAAHPLTSTIYVIDDDPSIRRSIERVLVANGLRVRTLDSVEAFLKEAAGVVAGCLVVDVQLPGMSGLDLQKQLASAGSTIPIIGMSGSANPRLADEAMRLGASAFLRKPFEAEALLNEVLRALRLPTRFP